MIRRTTVVDDVLPATASIGHLVDIYEWMADPDNIALIDDDGNVALFVTETVGRTYVGHICFISRGRTALQAAQRFLDVMFTEYNAAVVMGLTPVERREVIWFNIRLGFRDEGVVVTPQGEHRLFIMSEHDWINNG